MDHRTSCFRDPAFPPASTPDWRLLSHLAGRYLTPGWQGSSHLPGGVPYTWLLGSLTPGWQGEQNDFLMGTLGMV